MSIFHRQVIGGAQEKRIRNDTSVKLRTRERHLFRVNNKKELRKLIRISTKEHWTKLCNDLNNDVWGDGYKIVLKRTMKLIPC